MLCRTAPPGLKNSGATAARANTPATRRTYARRICLRTIRESPGGYGRDMRAPIQLDLHLPNFNFPGVGPDALFDKLVDIASAAERAAFGSVSVRDPSPQIPPVGPPQNWMFE